VCQFHNCVFRSHRRARLLSSPDDRAGAGDGLPLPVSDGGGTAAKDVVKKLPVWLEQEQQILQSPSPPRPLQPSPGESHPPPPLLPSQLFSPESSNQLTHAPTLLNIVDMYFLRECPAPSATMVQKVVSRLDDFPLLKLGRNGIAEMRSMFFSTDGTELLWKGKRGVYDVVPVRQLADVSLDMPAEEGDDAAMAKLNEIHLSFTLQFAHRSVTLAARSAEERCMFLAGVLCLRDQTKGCSVGSDIWDSIAPQLLETQAPLCEPSPSNTTRSSGKRRSVIFGHSLLLAAAESSQAHRPLKTARLKRSAAVAVARPSGKIVLETVMEKLIVCAASDDIVVQCRVQLLDDGTVVVSRIASANKAEDYVELARSSFFDVSASGVQSHVWMLQVRICVECRTVKDACDDACCSNPPLGCSCVRVKMVPFMSCR
jgi:hypothetical protein